ncbi:DUF899 family protein [Lentzea sp. BCCO 10_0856]|uniref:DUF899 family protein n=1 Tax=Lentzea miocenica TaxID=3095431 RepID=A0ABU4T7K6_9PSEU|nr:DUF899 family protein [Lentzea sp. BCCO 10_0856]MDX8034138.1 DUF899 family protein [Lentzea sp. BCCO 10_0856]
MSEAVVPMWPKGTDDRHVSARIELAKQERRLRDQIEAVAAARRALPPGPVLGEYEFVEATAAQDRVRLTDLFGEHETLVVYHLMFAPSDDEACPMCSMWVDGFNGVTPHLTRHTAFVVVAKAPPDRLLEWARRRGWDRLRVLSSHGTSFNEDMNAEFADEEQRPMVSVLRKTGDTVQHLYSLPANLIDGAERGIDLLSPVWTVLDLLPGGRGDWYASNDYFQIT